jgi:hypothetical protein
VVKEFYPMRADHLITDKIRFTNAIDLGHSMVRMRNDGIVQVNVGDDIEVDLKEAQEIELTIGVVTGGKKALVLNIAGANTSATNAARNHSASPKGSEFTIADAFVTKSLAQKILGNFYLNFHKPVAPTRLFDSEEKALEWLKGQL